jgi:hypothetical protein
MAGSFLHFLTVSFTACCSILVVYSCQNNASVFDMTYFSRSQRSKFIWVRLSIIPQLQFKQCQVMLGPWASCCGKSCIILFFAVFPIDVSIICWFHLPLFSCYCGSNIGVYHRILCMDFVCHTGKNMCYG